MKSKNFQWIIRIAYLLVFGGLVLFVNWVSPGMVPVMVGIMFLMMYVGFSMSMYQTKIDTIIRNVSLILGIVFIVGSLIKIDSNVVKFENNEEYSVSLGKTPNNDYNSSFYVTVSDSSKILNFKNVMAYGSGSWFIYIGEHVKKDNFYIMVEENKYIIGTRSYVNFYYKDEKVKNIQNKKFE